MSKNKEESKLYPKLTLQIFADEKCFGPGVALLLEKIEEKNSLRAAALDIEMSYSKAWTIIKRAEKLLGFELLVSKTGGVSGGGATLTNNAQRLLRDFRQYEKELNEYSKVKFSEYFSWIENNSILE